MLAPAAWGGRAHAGGIEIQKIRRWSEGFVGLSALTLMANWRVPGLGAAVETRVVVKVLLQIDRLPLHVSLFGKVAGHRMKKLLKTHLTVLVNIETLQHGLSTR